MNNWLRAIFIIVIALQTSFVGKIFGQNFQFDYSLKKDAINFNLVKNLVIIPIYINEKGPYNFILDTGVDPLIITDSTIVDASHLNTLRSVKINGTGEGDEIEAYISNNIKAKIGRATMEHVPTVILKEEVFNLSSYLGMKVYGLIGYNFFNSFVVKINYSASRVSFRLPQIRKKTTWSKLDLEFLDHKPYINVDLQVPDLGQVKAKLIIDCGASHALSLESYKEGIFPLPTPNFKANLGVGLGGKISGSVGRISSIKLGEYDLKNVLTNFPNYSDVAAKTKQKQRTGNLGADILKKFTVIFDYQDAAMYLKKNAYFNQAFEHDMSGMEIYVDDRQFQRVYVSRVEPDSPAEKAGILENDEILSINFIDVSNQKLDGIVNILKSGNDRTVLVEFSRNNKVYIKLLALKRRL